MASCVGVEGVRLFEGVPAAQAIAERPVEVSNYLPPSSLGLAGFYEFVPGDRETPAIRAGTISKYKVSRRSCSKMGSHFLVFVLFH